MDDQELLNYKKMVEMRSKNTYALSKRLLDSKDMIKELKELQQEGRQRFDGFKVRHKYATPISQMKAKYEKL